MERPPPPVIPAGFVAAWSEEHKTYFYVNEYTKQSTWVVPTSPAIAPQPLAQAQVAQPQRVPIQATGVASAETATSLAGAFQGGSYEIRHRDTNSILVLNLQGEVHAKPGTLVSYTQGVTIHGTFKISLKTLFTGESTNLLHIRGPGEATISNYGLGDIIALPMNNNVWIANRNAFLCMTDGVVKSSKAQSIGNSFGSTGLWVHQYNGVGALFLETFGAIMHKDLQPGENYFIDQHFAVAWNCSYTTETIQNQGGFMSMLATGEFWIGTSSDATNQTIADIDLFLMDAAALFCSTELSTASAQAISRLESDRATSALQAAFFSFEANMRLHRMRFLKTHKSVSGLAWMYGNSGTAALKSKRKQERIPCGSELEELERLAEAKAAVDRRVFQEEHDRILLKVKQSLLKL
ncbi:tryptophan RNA-binding attenuator protein-like domain-containing protein [Obelidium mucronatum]|nr:tryptophan RNA-binding attenuator protein-like domain-containing protein [Obelidium mucronatum]